MPERAICEDSVIYTLKQGDSRLMVLVTSTQTQESPTCTQITLLGGWYQERDWHAMLGQREMGCNYTAYHSTCGLINMQAIMFAVLVSTNQLSTPISLGITPR